jgi:hypothetical protein
MTDAERQLRKRILSDVLACLLENAQSPDRVGRRVIELNHVFELRFYPDLAELSKDLAKSLGITEGTLSSKLAQAYGTLNRILRE